MEEESILEEFKNVKLQLKEKSMDEEEFDATRETCMLLGGKLMDIRAKQHRCYSDNEDLEIVINREIMAIRYNITLSVVIFIYIGFAIECIALIVGLKIKISSKWMLNKSEQVHLSGKEAQHHLIDSDPESPLHL